MGHLLMSEKERLRKALFEMVQTNQLTLGKAAERLELSYRQVKRAYRRYRERGDEGLVHQSRGRSSNHGHPHRAAILARYRERYEGFGPTLAAEKLSEEDGLTVDHDTLRMWLLQEHLWNRERKRSPYRQRRERREQFGELVQMDGSFHDWFGDGRHLCLLNMVDDATGKTLAQLDPGETTRGVFLMLRQWIRQYGLPLALYVDRKTVYVSPKDTGFSHVERACEKLGIRIIKARSPQAKGRVERNHAVYQDRFVKELWLCGIKTMEEANTVLSGGFVDKLNSKFEKPALVPESAHRSFTEDMLTQALCWEYERQVQHDWTFSFRRKIYQLTKPYGSPVKPKVYVSVRVHLDGSVSVWYKGERLGIHVLPERPKVVNPVVSILHPVDTNQKKSTWGDANTRFFSRTG